MVQQEVLWLQVSVDDAQFVDILNTRDDLLVHLCRFFLLQPPVFYNVLKQLSARTILHNQVQIVVIFYHFIKLNYVWMPHFFEYSYFSIYPIYI